MSIGTIEELKAKKCKPCEGGVPPVPREEAERLLKDLSGWKLTEGGQRIRREWIVKHFMAALDFFNRIAELAEDEGHHPDLHLVGYRNVAIELWTHAIGGLSENDFITAAKIDELPIELKSTQPQDAVS
jgi:4a-hydroxytetrahydrobiopterin dehydratase